MKSIVRLLVYSFVLIFYAGNSFGQIPALNSLKVIKGKKNYVVENIYQSPEGFIWFLTSEGLIKYDGQIYTTFSKANGLANKVISAVAQSTDGQMWIGHPDGNISILKSDTATIFIHDSIQISEKITDIQISDNHTVWIATQGQGLFVIDKQNVKKINSENGLNDDFVYDIEQASDNTFWIGTDAGVTQLDKNGKILQNFTMSNGLPDNIVKQIHIEENLLYVGMEEQGLGFIDLKEMKFQKFGNWNFGNLIDFEILSNNEIWVTTAQDGIIRISNNQGKYSYKIIQHSVSENLQKPGYMLKDREQNIWIGAKEGVILYTNNNFNFIDHTEDIPFKQVYSFISENRNTFWAATDKGIFEIKVSETGSLEYKSFFKTPEYEQVSFVSLYLDVKGYLWASTYGFGVFRIKTSDWTFEHFTSKKELSNDNVLYVSGRNQNVYMSTLGGGAMKADISGETPIFTHISSELGLRGKYVYQTVEDSAGQIWYGFDGEGIQMFDGTKWNNFEADSNMTKQTVYGFAIHPKKVSFFTNSGNIYTVENNQIENTTKKFNIPNLEIASLTYCLNGNLLINTNSGIYILDAKTNNLRIFNEDYGISDFEPNLNAVHTDSTGAIWIGTSKGTVEYLPHKNQDKISPILFLNSILVNYSAINHSETEFAHTQKHWIFNFTGLWYKNPDAISFRYILEGYDKDWSIPTKNTSVTYSNVPPGDYVFKVQISHEPGNWADVEETSYSFIINQPIWMRWWFIAGSIALLISIIYMLFKWRTQRLIKAKEELELEVQRRTSEILKQKEEIEAQRDEIQSKNKNITDSILYARRIQSAMLPPDDFINELLPSLFILYKPRDIVSGDFYWIQQINNKIYLVAADCTGHGVPGAFMSMLGISTLQQIVTNDNPDIKASEILNQLRDTVKKALRQTGKTGEAQDGMDMALCIYEKEAHKLQFAGANNPLIIIRNNEIVKYKADKMPIGIYKHDQTDFTNHCIELQPNDAVYIFTDGFEDQFGGPQGRKFLAKHFYELLSTISKLPASEQQYTLENTIESWRGDNEQIDDILVLGFKHVI